MVWLVAAVALAPLPDVVYSAVDSDGIHHLYRWRTRDGAVAKLTGTTFEDVDPQLAPDGNHILFWRKDPLDVLGRTWLCSILPDGTGLKVHRRMTGSDYSSPREELISANVPDSDHLPALPSEYGGRDLAGPVTRMRNGTLVLGYYDQASRLGLADARGKLIRNLNLRFDRQGKSAPAEILHNTQWRDNPGGFRALWADSKHTTLLLQTVARETGPNLYWLDARNGRILKESHGDYIEDVDEGSGAFLASPARVPEDDGDIDRPPISLVLHLSGGSKIEKVADRGACFVRTRAAMPSAPNRSALVKVPPSPNRQGLVFAADRYIERLGCVFAEGFSHLYRIDANGTKVTRLTNAEADDCGPSFDAKSGRIYFWRGAEAGAQRLCSIRPDGTDFRRTEVKSQGSPWRWPLAFWRGPYRSRLRPVADSFEATILDAKGRSASPSREVHISADGLRATMGRYAEPERWIDFATDRIRTFPEQYKEARWLDRNHGIALEGPSPDDSPSRPLRGAILLLDGRGKVQRRLKTTFPDEQDVILPGFFSQLGEAVPLSGTKTVLWNALHPMSDGGYSFLTRIDLVSGKVTYLANQGLEGVSEDGQEFATTELGWVGGYKGAGAEKLGTLHLWSSATWKDQRLGFRRAVYHGACFLPAP